MAFSDNSSRQSLIPSYLYSSSSSNNLLLNKLTSNRAAAPFSNPSAENVSPAKIPVMIQAPNEPLGKIEMYSPQFYAACTVGGILSCGLTHMTVTPLDLVKCNMQVSILSLIIFILRVIFSDLFLISLDLLRCVFSLYIFFFSLCMLC